MRGSQVDNMRVDKPWVTGHTAITLHLHTALQTHQVSRAKLEHRKIKGGTATVIHTHILVMAAHTELVFIDWVCMDAVQGDAAP
ncbi:hypothetical protein E2C01_013218 [Portunus trituberculatus]|uniref:Uncharacterized protein n=1 Tax=Portunus trituberculatus TaxID=210409 RepID=A0A5B7DFM3_PORTR|nr:hypothetical protein [Portunus trituberculatus]